jgi:hypothetical protein
MVVEFLPNQAGAAYNATRAWFGKQSRTTDLENFYGYLLKRKEREWLLNF